LEQWKIRRDRGREEKPCCRRAAQREYFAVLELPSCTRRDLCAPCFQRLEQESDVPPIYWKARRKVARKGPVLDLVSLKLLFDRLGEREADDTAAGLRYFVALLLLRKRIVKLVDATTPEEEAADLVVADPKRPEAPPVPLFAPELDDDRLAGLKQELIAAIGEPGEDGAEA
jgi:hypothetical protein